MPVTYLTKDYLGENESVRTFFCSANRKSTMHSHEFWELSYVYEGQGKSCLLTATQPIVSGEFLLISPGAVHSLTPLPKGDGAAVRLCNCLFTPEYFKRIFKAYSQIADIKNYELYKLLESGEAFCLHLSDDNISNIKSLMWLTAHECGHSTIGSDAVIELAMTNLFICISRLYENYLNGEAAVPKNPVIDKVKHYMQTCFGYQITLEDLAAQVHLSREYLSRYFKKCTGKTISEYLLEIRMEKARDKLSRTAYPVTDIAEYCGYLSVENFRKSFKRTTGLSPGEYRKRYNKNRIR